MQYKNVDSGDTLTHVTLNNEEIAINFSKPYKYFAVSGNNTLLAALNGNIVEGTDGVYSASNGIIIIQAEVPVNTVYVKGSDEADVWAGTTANSIPFGKSELPKGLKEVEYIVAGGHSRSLTSGFSAGGVQTNDAIEFTTEPIALSGSQCFAGCDSAWDVGFGMNSQPYNKPSNWGSCAFLEGTDLSTVTNYEKRTYRFTVTKNTSLWIGYYRDGQYGYFGKIYGCKVIRGGNNVIYDFVPVYNENTATYGMYDRTNIKFCPATTNTSFRNPDGYLEVYQAGIENDGIYILMRNLSSTEDTIIRINDDREYVIDRIGKTKVIQTAAEDSSDFTDTTITSDGYTPIYYKCNAGDKIKIKIISGDYFSTLVATYKFSTPTNDLTGAEKMFKLTGSGLTDDGIIMKHQDRYHYKTYDGSAIVSYWGTNDGYKTSMAMAKTNDAARITNTYSSGSTPDAFSLHFLYKDQEYFARAHYRADYTGWPNDYGHCWSGPESLYRWYQLMELADDAGVEL